MKKIPFVHTDRQKASCLRPKIFSTDILDLSLLLLTKGIHHHFPSLHHQSPSAIYYYCSKARRGMDGMDGMDQQANSKTMIFSGGRWEGEYFLYTGKRTGPGGEGNDDGVIRRLSSTGSTRGTTMAVESSSSASASASASESSPTGTGTGTATRIDQQQRAKAASNSAFSSAASAARGLSVVSAPSSATICSYSSADDVSTSISNNCNNNNKNNNGNKHNGNNSKNHNNNKNSNKNSNKNNNNGNNVITKVKIAKNVTTIPVRAFCDIASTLRHVALSTSVQEIKSSAFARCHALETITVWDDDDDDSDDDDNKNDDDEFDDDVDDENNKHHPPMDENETTSTTGSTRKTSKKINQEVIYSQLHRIGSGAFSGCSSLTYVQFLSSSSPPSSKIPSSATARRQGRPSTKFNQLSFIGSRAFFGCHSLRGIISIPCNIQTIADFTFFACQSITSIQLPSSVTKIQMHAFAGCTKLSSIDIVSPSGVPSSVPSSSSSSSSSTAKIQQPTQRRVEQLNQNKESTAPLPTLSSSSLTAASTSTSTSTSSKLKVIGKYAFSECTNLLLYSPVSYTTPSLSPPPPSSSSSSSSSTLQFCTSKEDEDEDEDGPSMTALERFLFSNTSIETIGTNAFYTSTVNVILPTITTTSTSTSTTATERHHGKNTNDFIDNDGQSNNVQFLNETRDKSYKHNKMTMIPVPKKKKTKIRKINTKLLQFLCDVNRGGRRFIFSRASISSSQQQEQEQQQQQQQEKVHAMTEQQGQQKQRIDHYPNSLWPLILYRALNEMPLSLERIGTKADSAVSSLLLQSSNPSPFSTSFVSSASASASASFTASSTLPLSTVGRTRTEIKTSFEQIFKYNNPKNDYDDDDDDDVVQTIDMTIQNNDNEQADDIHSTERNTIPAATVPTEHQLQEQEQHQRQKKTKWYDNNDNGTDDNIFYRDGDDDDEEEAYTKNYVLRRYSIIYYLLLHGSPTWQKQNWYDENDIHVINKRKYRQQQQHEYENSNMIDTSFDDSIFPLSNTNKRRRKEQE